MDEDLTTIHITEALSSSLIMDLMDEYPNLREITCAPSVYERTPKNYIDALEQLDIEVNKKYNWGAKSQTNGEEKIVLDLAKKGLNARENLIVFIICLEKTRIMLNLIIIEENMTTVRLNP